jgi:hypothetical protein
MFNIVRKSNNSVVTSFASEDEAKTYLSDIGPQRNFLKIEEVIEQPTEIESKVEAFVEFDFRLACLVDNAKSNPNFLKEPTVENKIRALYAMLPKSERQRSVGQSELSQHIMSVLQDKDFGASCSYIATALVDKGVYADKSVALKKVSDRCWLMAKQGLLIKANKGVYALKK